LNLAMRQRLVGLMVLGSLALIFIPLLLDGEGVETPPLNLRIPPAPVLDQTPLPEPQRPEIVADRVESLPVVQLPFTESEEPFQLSDTNSESAAAAAADSAPAVANDGTDAVAGTAAESAAAATVQPQQTPPVAATRPPAAAPAPVATPRSETEPALDAQGLPEAWTVRLGVFAERANAEALVSRLLAAGHKAYLQPVRTAQGNTSGVFVGPVLTRQEASSLQRQLMSASYGEGMILRYSISP
jgi:DedD protein